MPDVSVVYKLHLECGRLINLYDWLQAFISVVDPEADTSNKKAIDQKLQYPLQRIVRALHNVTFFHKFAQFKLPLYLKTFFFVKYFLYIVQVHYTSIGIYYFLGFIMYVLLLFSPWQCN